MDNSFLVVEALAILCICFLSWHCNHFFDEWKHDFVNTLPLFQPFHFLVLQFCFDVEYNCGFHIRNC